MAEQESSVARPKGVTVSAEPRTKWQKSPIEYV